MLLDRLLDPDALDLWLPVPGPQLDAFFSKADILFYGGAAGGGKTDLIIGLAATAHRETIIYRREYPQFQGIEKRELEIFKNRRLFNENKQMWRLPDGRTIEHGAVQYEEDKEKYQGRPHDLIAFDEAPHFPEIVVRFLSGWNRTSVEGQRTRVLLTGNPPTNSEGEWIIRFFAPWLDPKHTNPAAPGELRWYAMLDGVDTELAPDEPGGDGQPFIHEGSEGPEEVQPTSRTFIPARVDDNPYYLKTGYKRMLQGLPEPLRSQMLYGRFDIVQDDDAWQVIPTAWVDAAIERGRKRDLAPGPIDQVGVDVAAGGGDATVFAFRRDKDFTVVQIPGTSTPDGYAVANRLAAILVGERPPVIMVDAIGVGADALSRIRDFYGEAAVAAIASEGSERTDRSGALTFRNKRAEWWWKFREMLDPDYGDDIALPDDRELRADLTAPRWQPSAQGLTIESKKDIRKRIGRSTNKGDALIMAAAQATDDLQIFL